MDIGELLKKFSTAEPKSNSLETSGLMLWEYSNDSILCNICVYDVNAVNAVFCQDDYFQHCQSLASACNIPQILIQLFKLFSILLPKINKDHGLKYMVLFSDNVFLNKLLWIINNSLISELIDECSYFVLSLLHYQPNEMVQRFNEVNILHYMSERFENWCKIEEQPSYEAMENYMRSLMMLMDSVNNQFVNTKFDLNNSSNKEIISIVQSLVNYGCNTDDENYMVCSLHIISPLFQVKPKNYPNSFNQYLNNLIECLPIVLSPVESIQSAGMIGVGEKDITEIFDELKSTLYHLISLYTVMLFSVDNRIVNMLLECLTKRINQFKRMNVLINLLHTKLRDAKISESLYETIFVSYNEIMMIVKKNSFQKKEYKQLESII